MPHRGAGGHGYAKNPFQAWELTSLEGLMFKAVDIQGGGAQCGPYSRQPPYSSPKRSPTLRSSGALKEGRMEHSSASVQKPRATTCLRSTRRSQQVRAYKSSRGWNNQARRHRPHRLTRQATQTAIFGADLKRAIEEASVRVEPAGSTINFAAGCSGGLGSLSPMGPKSRRAIDAGWAQD